MFGIGKLWLNGRPLTLGDTKRLTERNLEEHSSMNIGCSPTDEYSSMDRPMVYSCADR